MLIEQAIIVATANNKLLVSHSPGLTDSEAFELAASVPPYDCLAGRDGAHASISFHRLASGRYSVSRSSRRVEAGLPADGTYMQSIVAPPDILAHFANNPFFLLRAAAVGGRLRVLDVVPEVLKPLELKGRVPVIDGALLAQLSHDPGPQAMATLVQLALSSDHVAVAAAEPLERLVAGFVSLLPVECRTEFSFTTGLPDTSANRLRISSLGDDRERWRSIATDGVTLLDLENCRPAEIVAWQGWAGFVGQVLAERALWLLADAFEQPRPGLTCQGLTALAHQLRVELASNGENIDAGDIAAPDCLPPSQVSEAWDTAGGGMMKDVNRSRGHLLTRAQEGATAAGGELATTISAQPPATLELLERIDDLVFAAIAGDEQALV
ncbi:MAG TPA: hypothetical protein VHV08_01690, partial [Pirellulales bacterium]|nr:hypothetical protein [Pirellulales bacterium]